MKKAKSLFPKDITITAEENPEFILLFKMTLKTIRISRLHKLRIKSGLSQDELSNKVGITTASLQKFEQGFLSHKDTEDVSSRLEKFLKPGNIIK